MGRSRSLRLVAYLEHITEAAGSIRHASLRTSSSPHREACRNVLRSHADFAAAHDEIPWRAPYEMRNALAHGYFNVDLATTWQTNETDVPAFATQIAALLPLTRRRGPIRP
jgi:hypothetical protein